VKKKSSVPDTIVRGVTPGGRCPIRSGKATDLATAHQGDRLDFEAAYVELAVEYGPSVRALDIDQPRSGSQRHAKLAGGICRDRLLASLAIGADKQYLRARHRQRFPQHNLATDILNRCRRDPVESDFRRRGNRACLACGRHTIGCRLPVRTA